MSQSVFTYLRALKLFASRFDPVATAMGLAVRIITPASGGTPVIVVGSYTQASNATVSRVAATAASQTLFASDTLRAGATIYNDSAVNAYVKFGATASNVSFTVLILPQGYYEVPYGYTGQIDAIMASGSFSLTALTVATANPGAPANSTVAHPAGTGLSQMLLAANTARKGGTIYLDHATNTAFLKLGVTASATDFTVKLMPGAYYEIPNGYVGRVDAIMSAATGNFATTELS